MKQCGLLEPIQYVVAIPQLDALSEAFFVPFADKFMHMLQRAVEAASGAMHWTLQDGSVVSQALDEAELAVDREFIDASLRANPFTVVPPNSAQPGNALRNTSLPATLTLPYVMVSGRSATECYQQLSALPPQGAEDWLRLPVGTRLTKWATRDLVKCIISLAFLA